MTAYDFQTQLRKGEAAERELDARFAEWFEIAPASADEQRQGIDRWFTGKRTGMRRAVEIKTDFRAAQTGNSFIETVSVGGQRAGWAYTSQADWLLYYVPRDRVVMLRLTGVRIELAQWVNRWPEVTVQNDGYVTRGVVLPLRELERAAFNVVRL